MGFANINSMISAGYSHHKNGGNAKFKKKKKLSTPPKKFNPTPKTNKPVTVSVQPSTVSLIPITGKLDLYHIVYIVEHIKSKCFYIGVHSCKDVDVLTKYTTSSELINKIIEVEGISSLSVSRLFYCTTRRGAVALERTLIVKNFDSTYNLNRAYETNKIPTWRLGMKYNYHGVKVHECKLTIEAKGQVGKIKYCSITENLISTL